MSACTGSPFAVLCVVWRKPQWEPADKRSEVRGTLIGVFPKKNMRSSTCKRKHGYPQTVALRKAAERVIEGRDKRSGKCPLAPGISFCGVTEDVDVALASSWACASRPLVQRPSACNELGINLEWWLSNTRDTITRDNTRFASSMET